MSKSLIRKNQLHPDINDLVGQYGSGYFPSKNSTVFTTGNQTIGGKKTFATGIVSPLGIGNPGDLSDAEIRLWETSSESYQSISSVDGGFTFTRGSDEINLEFTSEEISLTKYPGIAYRFKSGYEGTVPIDANVVHVTGGNEIISGVKTFATGIVAPNLVYNTGNQTISGVKTFATGIFAPNLVYNTGNQTISGVKTFTSNIFAPNLVYSSGDYNYFTTSITLGNNYINLANSASGITGTLPAIASGRNYIVKNLNTGTLTVTGSNFIDGNVNLKLYKNESAHLLGVNNAGFTGWVSLNTNPGIS